MAPLRTQVAGRTGSMQPSTLHHMSYRCRSHSVVRVPRSHTHTSNQGLAFGSKRLGRSAVPAARLRAERPNHVWALDFQFDQTADGRVLKLLNIVDEHTREALAIVAARSITADATASMLEGIVARRGTAPAYIRCDLRARAHGQRPARLVPVLRHRQQLHRARRAVGEPIRRVVQRPVARRVPGRRAVRQPARGAGAARGLADRVQHEAPAQQPGLARPGCLRRALRGSATRWTLISGGPVSGGQVTSACAAGKE